MKRQEKLLSTGFFNVDKPSGLTSSTVVNKCKWLSGVPCGHMGTLDPLASGVLPVGVGNATRLFDHFLEKEKVYLAHFTFGVSSDTLDSTGKLVYGGEIPTPQQIENVLPAFFGDIMQVPPKYSAKNVNGRRGYELARAGVDFELAAKKVHIFGMRLTEQIDEKTFGIEIRCGGGTYIRSLARDIATALHTNAVMSALRRTKSGIFEIGNSIPFSFLENDPPVSELEKYLIPTESVLPFPVFQTQGKEEQMLFNGMTVFTDYVDGTYKIYKDDAFYGLLEVTKKRAKIKTKLC
ncbi:MAG: tRNA pseudouridine(55) synthase TruB [Clostridia bacterium]|nr:tRNA pseudouridine(55) synthase TruB [Clostridia bacterium]